MKIDPDLTYFVLMRPMHRYGFVSFTCDNDPEYWVKCKLVPYHFDGFDYKLFAVPVQGFEDFDADSFYTNDFEKLIDLGQVIPCGPNATAVVHRKVAESVGGFYLVHEFDEVI